MQFQQVGPQVANRVLLSEVSEEVSEGHPLSERYPASRCHARVSSFVLYRPRLPAAADAFLASKTESSLPSWHRPASSKAAHPGLFEIGSAPRPKKPRRNLQDPATMLRRGRSAIPTPARPFDPRRRHHSTSLSPPDTVSTRSRSA